MYIYFLYSQGSPDDLSDSLRESLMKKDEQITAMNQHLQRLQVGRLSL